MGSLSRIGCKRIGKSGINVFDENIATAPAGGVQQCATASQRPLENVG